MFRVIFSATVLLLPSAVLCHIRGASEIDNLDREIDEFERLAFGSGESHRHHHRRRPRHIKHRRPYLRHHKRALLFADAPVAVNPAPPPSEDLLPGRHPDVARKLGHMESAMHELSGSQQAASMARKSLEDNVKDAVRHMNEAVGIKRQLARTEAQIRVEEVRLKKLEDDRLRLDRTHGHLVSSLHHIMEPKIQFAETRLKQREHALRDLESNAQKWKAEETKFHDASLATIEQRKQAKIRLETADEEEIKIRHEREAAKKEFEGAKHQVAYNIQAYQFAQAHARAASSTEERGKETVHEAKRSLRRLSGILNMEQRRVDESMAIGKDRVQGKIRELESVKEKSAMKLSKLSQEYNAWQNQQRLWARSVAAKKELTRDAAQAYAVRQQAVLDAANAKVAYDAESDSDWAWDEWPTAGKRDTDEVDLGTI